jgi:hypothetical protein
MRATGNLRPVPSSIQSGWTALGIPVALGVTAFVAGWASTASPKLLSLILTGLAVAVLCSLPMRLLPLAAITFIVALPAEALPVPPNAKVLSIAAIPLLAWAVRARSRSTLPTGSAVIAASFLGWICLSWAFSTYHDRFAVGAVLSLALLPVVVMLRPSTGGDSGPEDFFLKAVVLLAAYAVVEKYLIHGNPLYGSLYHQASPPLEQAWSTYRATTTMGHPLVNGTVFAATLVLAVGRFLDRRSPPRPALLSVVLLLGGLVSVVSRGAIAGAGAGLIVLMALHWGPSVSQARKLVIGVGITVAAVVAVSALVARSSSSEGSASTANRASVGANTALALRGNEIVGVGPGKAEQYRIDHALPGQYQPVLFALRKRDTRRVSIENAYAQMAIGVGYPGLALFVTLVAGVVMMAVRSSQSRAAGCAIIAMMVAVFGYNAFDSHPQLLVLLALLMVFASARAAGVEKPATN